MWAAIPRKTKRRPDGRIRTSGKKISRAISAEDENVACPAFRSISRTAVASYIPRLRQRTGPRLRHLGGGRTSSMSTTYGRIFVVLRPMSRRSRRHIFPGSAVRPNFWFILRGWRRAPTIYFSRASWGAHAINRMGFRRANIANSRHRRLFFLCRVRGVKLGRSS